MKKNLIFSRITKIFWQFFFSEIADKHANNVFLLLSQSKFYLFFFVHCDIKIIISCFSLALKILIKKKNWILSQPQY